ncbi:MAG: helix-turn-helix domain-containing protein [Cyclobacteriaceae bacterium]
MDEIMTVEEVAKYLKMKPQTIYIWAQKGKIPAAKIGKEWRFRRDVIDAWFNQYFSDEFQSLLDGLKKKKGNNN